MLSFRLIYLLMLFYSSSADYDKGVTVTSNITIDCYSCGPVNEDCRDNFKNSPSERCSSCMTCLIKGNQVWRGCIRDSLPGETCYTCNNEDYCNSIDLTSTRCFRCNSVMDPECTKEQTIKKDFVACPNRSNKCVAYTNHGRFYRDCAETRPANLGPCKDGHFCRECSGWLCNKELVRVCYHCDSANDNLDCWRERKLGDPILICDSNNDALCVEEFVGNILNRTCLSRASYLKNYAKEVRSLDNFKLTDLENLGPYTACYTCNSRIGYRFCWDNQLENNYIWNYRSCGMTHECMTINAGEYVIRDCKSRVEYLNLCNLADVECTFCQSTLCNFEEVFQPRAACLQCSETDPACPILQVSVPSVTLCPRSKVMTPNCFRYTFPDGSGTRYGCAQKEWEFCENSTCLFCNDNMCNYPLRLNQRCLQCNSKNEQECATNPKMIQGTACVTPNKFGFMGCFARTNALNDVYRGCTADLNRYQIQACFYNLNTKCIVCNGNNCNNVKIQNGSDGLRLQTGAFIIALIIYILNNF